MAQTAGELFRQSRRQPMRRSLFLFLLALSLLLLPPSIRGQNPINTVAGNGFIGDGGAATSAIVAGPQAVAVDPLGNIYIADGFNNRVRRVDHSTLIITTFAGTGIAGVSGNGGLATSATFLLPQAIAVDSTGNFVYITDSASDTVRVVNVSTGIISLYAGTGVPGFG